MGIPIQIGRSGFSPITRVRNSPGNSHPIYYIPMDRAMVMHEPNRLLSKGLVVCLVVGAGWHCGANRGQGEALDAVISVVTTRRPDTTRLLVVIDTASLRAAANLESVAAYELTAQLPPGIVLGIPLFNPSRSPVRRFSFGRCGPRLYQPEGVPDRFRRPSN